jgi:hypothetical protein
VSIGIGAGPGILHDEAVLRQIYLQSRVVKIGWLPSLAPSLEDLIDPAVKAHKPHSTGPKRQPIQVDGRSGSSARLRLVNPRHSKERLWVNKLQIASLQKDGVLANMDAAAILG